MSNAVLRSVEGTIMVLTVSNPPVNALGHAVRQGLWDAIVEIGQRDDIEAAVIIGDGRTFPAGADIKEFGKAPKNPWLPDVVNHIESCEKPIVAAIHGTALGGGLEIALGAHYRIAQTDSKLGLPEVQLGILPGAGGTQRLPRIVGAHEALQMMTSGKAVSAARALKFGILDRMSATDLLSDAINFAREIVSNGSALRRTRDRMDGLADHAANVAALAEFKSTLEHRMRGQFAPFRIIECVEAAITSNFDDGLRTEREKFDACMSTPQREGMIHAFFAERLSAKVPEAARGTPRPVEHIGIVGGGTMGAGICVAALDAGLRVTMVERDEEGIARGKRNVEQVFDRLIGKGRLSKDQKDAVMARFGSSIDFGSLNEVDMVIEAVFEDMAIKKAVFSQLDEVAKPGAVLASNTSYLDIEEIASATKRPTDVIGLHFFSPANIMKLLEIIVPESANDDAVSTGFAMAKRLRKTPVRSSNHDGFIGNRIWRICGACAAHMMEDGASPYEIDSAIKNFGYPMGPHAVYDLAGLDIGWANRKKDAPHRDPADRYVRIADKICERGWFGQKTGRGFYVYAEGTRVGRPDPEVLSIIAAEREARGIAPRQFSEEEIIRRYLAAMVNEGAKILADGVAYRPSDIDVTLIHGYGFPRYRGGPMKYADMYGLERLLEDLRDFSNEDPRFWSPAPLITDLVEQGKKFDDLNKDS